MITTGPLHEPVRSLVGRLVQRGVTVGAAESVTGGLFGTAMARCPGSQPVFKGSLVAYAGDVKRSVLGVPEGPVVSFEAAEAMAVGARRLFGSDLAVALTGVAGPDRQDGQPVGTVFVGLGTQATTTVERHRLEGSPDTIRAHAVLVAVGMLAAHLGGPAVHASTRFDPTGDEGVLALDQSIPGWPLLCGPRKGVWGAAARATPPPVT